jgi:DNA gyrase/topoisomerase IV subunit A
MKISTFFENDYVNQASYDNLRKIASAIDGQKNASRKILYTILEKNIKDEIKVSQLGSKVSEFAEYLHGNMDGVIVGLAQNYPGTNNVPLLSREGNFGTRFSQEASASRYIYTFGTKEFFNIFNKDDNAILEKQYFEGQEIEPKFYYPSLPILLINGSDGVSSGFAQKILPRNPNFMRQYIQHKLTGSKYDKNAFVPYFEGFTGIIEQGENTAQWIIKGKIVRKSINKIEIVEVPVGYDLKGYLSVLDDLEDKKIIQTYKDKSENDKFLFEVTISSKDLKEWDDEILLSKLKLIKKITENYTCIDADNRIKVFEKVEDIMDYYIFVKKDGLRLRKDYLIEKYDLEIRLDYSKYLFVKNIVEEKLIINKRKKSDIEIDMSNIKGIIKRDDSYDYLLNMSIQSLTEERMKRLEDEIKNKKVELDKLKDTSIEDIWISDLINNKN